MGARGLGQVAGTLVHMPALQEGSHGGAPGQRVAQEAPELLRRSAEPGTGRVPELTFAAYRLLSR